MSGGESPDPQGARLWHSGHHTTSSQVVHAAILLVGSPNPVNPNMYGLYSSQAISVGGGKTQRAVRVPSDTARQWRTPGSPMHHASGHCKPTTTNSRYRALHARDVMVRMVHVQLSLTSVLNGDSIPHNIGMHRRQPRSRRCYSMEMA